MDPVSFASSSKLLELRWTREGHRKHRQKVKSIKISHSACLEPPPRPLPHLAMKLKKLQQEEERGAEIERQNRLLVDKLSRILNKPSVRVDNWNPYEASNLHMVRKITERRKRQKLLVQDNQTMSSRLMSIKSSYDHGEWERDFQRHKSIKEMLDSTTKDYSYSRRGQGWSSNPELDEGRGEVPSPSPMPSSISSESDPSDGASKLWRNNAKLAKLKQQPQVMHENEARMLMKVCNKMVQANEILIKCLVRKSPRQRQGIRTRFRELYDLDLETQLKSSLAKDYRGVIEGLLHNPYLKFVTEIHANIKDVDPFALITKCMQHDSACLKKLFDVYKKHYSSSVESDVQDFFGDPDTREVTSAALAGLLSRKPVTREVLDAYLAQQQQQQQQPLEPVAPLVQGLRAHGPDLLAELEASGRRAQPEEDASSAAGLWRHLLELATKRPHVRAVASRLEGLTSGDLKELVQLVQLLAESPSILSEVNSLVEKSHGGGDIRELLVTRCPGDTGPVISALLPAPSRRAS